MKTISIPYTSSSYDSEIRKTIPYYDNFHLETLDLVKNSVPNCQNWLDIGCGTGTLVLKASAEFENTNFILSDYSSEMIDKAKTSLSSINNVSFCPPCSSENILSIMSNKVDVITAIQVHHYLSKEDRLKATVNCFNLLNDNGIYITFENIRPIANLSIKNNLNRWGNFQLNEGRKLDEVEKHKERFDKGYFPITILEHLDLLKSIGFKNYDIFWYSHMQAGFYGLK